VDGGGCVAVNREDAALLVQLGDVQDGAARPAWSVTFGVGSSLLGEVEEPGATAAIDDYIGVLTLQTIGWLSAPGQKQLVGLTLPVGEVARSEGR